MLGINFLFILRKSVNFSVILFSNRKMNSTSVTVVVFLRKNAPNFGIFHSNGYTPTTVAAVEFSLSMPSCTPDCLLINV